MVPLVVVVLAPWSLLVIAVLNFLLGTEEVHKMSRQAFSQETSSCGNIHDRFMESLLS